MFEMHAAWRALARACAKTGNRIAARIAMIAITTKSSMSVKPLVLLVDTMLCRLGWRDIDTFGSIGNGLTEHLENNCFISSFLHDINRCDLLANY
jgi:hypothetical protein